MSAVNNVSDEPYRTGDVVRIVVGGHSGLWSVVDPVGDRWLPRQPRASIDKYRPSRGANVERARARNRAARRARKITRQNV